ncbi:MAG: carbon storage regulator CsrA [Candidatus Kapaibacteriales bacterium]
MLVLSRKIGEVITIGNSVSVTVLSFDRGIVRLGIEAPKEIAVHRKEVHDKIVQMNRMAANTNMEEFKSMLPSTGLKDQEKNS